MSKVQGEDVAVAWRSEGKLFWGGTAQLALCCAQQGGVTGRKEGSSFQEWEGVLRSSRERVGRREDEKERSRGRKKGRKDRRGAGGGKGRSSEEYVVTKMVESGCNSSCTPN